MKVNITWRNRPVYNPVARVLILMILLAMVPLFLLFLVITAPIHVPLHFVLKALGRKGFTDWDGTSVKYNVDRRGFEKAVDHNAIRQHKNAVRRARNY